MLPVPSTMSSLIYHQNGVIYMFAFLSYLYCLYRFKQLSKQRPRISSRPLRKGCPQVTVARNNSRVVLADVSPKLSVCTMTYQMICAAPASYRLNGINDHEQDRFIKLKTESWGKRDEWVRNGGNYTTWRVTIYAFFTWQQNWGGLWWAQMTENSSQKMRG